MSVTYKDIDQLSQKSAVAGTEKIPVSDTQYLTPAQIATSKQVHLTDESDMPASPDSSTLYLIDDDGSGGNANIVHLEDESEMPASPDPDTLYAIDESSEIFVSTSAQVLTSAQQTQARTNIGAADASVTPKYVLLADEAAYTALATKDSGTLYLIPKTS